MTRLPVGIHDRVEFALAWVVVSAAAVSTVSSMAITAAGGNGATWWTVLVAVLGWHAGHDLWDHYRFERLIRRLHEQFPDE